MTDEKHEFAGEWGGQWTVDLGAELGRGAFAAVYKGAGSDGTPVAVKVLLPRPGERDIRQRTREVEIAERLRNENPRYLVRTLDYLLEDDRLFVAMERGSGQLEIGSGGLEEEDTLAVIRQIAKGIAELHSYEIVHRDLKPANTILVAGVWKLSDFGISRNTAIDTQTVTFSDWGTLSYMAPERFETGGRASMKTDLYSLGCIAYELLTGERFASGDEDAIVNAHRARVPDLPETLHPILRSTVLSLLEKPPTRRPASAADALGRLQRVAVVESPVLARLQEAEAGLAYKAAERQAADHAETDAERRRLDALEQAFVDLHAIIDDAFVGIEQTVSTASISNELRTGSRAVISMSGGAFGIELWRRRSELEDDNLVAAGEVRVQPMPPGSQQPSSLATRSPIIANVAAEQVDEGVQWFVYRFKRSALAQSYDVRPAPKTNPHGFGDSYFLDRYNRHYMKSRPMHIWSTETSPLTPELVQELFTGAMEWLSSQAGDG